MLSVMKHTKYPVKFWLLKNYLSPQFKVNFKKHFFYFVSLTSFRQQFINNLEKFPSALLACMFSIFS